MATEGIPRRCSQLLSVPSPTGTATGGDGGRPAAAPPRSSCISRSIEPTTTSRGHNSVMRSLKSPLLAFLSVFAVCGFTGTAAAGGSPSHPVQVRVVLAQHRAVAGHPIKGSVILTNTTARPITVDTCAENGWLAVGLSGSVNSFPFTHTLVGCAPTVRLDPGDNRFPVTVITTYAGCTQPQPAGGASPTLAMPTCTVAGSPPLPPGIYSTKVDLVGLSGLTQAANRVVVHLRAPKNPPRLAPCADEPGMAPAPVTVPDVVGASSSAAAFVLARACLNAGYAAPVGSSVIAETPPVGSMVPEHSTVTLSTR